MHGKIYSNINGDKISVAICLIYHCQNICVGTGNQDGMFSEFERSINECIDFYNLGIILQYKPLKSELMISIECVFVFILILC